MTYGGFHEFLQERIKDKGLDSRRLSRLSGISLRYIEGLVGGDASLLPPAPYVYGYLRRLGELLEFDGETWWQRIKGAVPEKAEGVRSLRTTGTSLLRPMKVAAAALAVFGIAYFIIQSPHVLGKPVLSLYGTSEAPIVTSEQAFTIRGTLENGDVLSVNGEIVELGADGSWKKEVLLTEGLNFIEVRARKFLGRETIVTEQVVYVPEKIFQEATSDIKPNS